VSKIEYIDQEEMEQITQRILRDFGFNFENNILPRAVPIDEIIEFHYKLDISWESIDHFDSTGLVMAAIIPSERKIIMNESCKELFEEKIGTMNFTMAHELGHWVLHVTDKLNIQGLLDLKNEIPTFYCRSKTKKPPEEYQADMFAGSLLMPKPTLQKVIANLKVNGQIQLKQLYILAPMLKVSISALKVRLNQLGLLYIHDDGSIYESRNEYNGQLTLDI
jgi:hypothetical protein